MTFARLKYVLAAARGHSKASEKWFVMTARSWKRLLSARSKSPAKTSALHEILFPTQKNTWKELQKLDEKRDCNSNTPSYKNACGRPGINGGYIANPYVKFGVNCFGKKPDATENDLSRLNETTDQTYPKTREEYEMESKINDIKRQSPEMLQLSSYNTKQWKRTG